MAVVVHDRQRQGQLFAVGRLGGILRLVRRAGPLHRRAACLGILLVSIRRRRLDQLQHFSQFDAALRADHHAGPAPQRVLLGMAEDADEVHLAVAHHDQRLIGRQTLARCALAGGGLIHLFARRGCGGGFLLHRHLARLLIVQIRLAGAGLIHQLITSRGGKVILHKIPLVAALIRRRGRKPSIIAGGGIGRLRTILGILRSISRRGRIGPIIRGIHLGSRYRNSRRPTSLGKSFYSPAVAGFHTPQRAASCLGPLPAIHTRVRGSRLQVALYRKLAPTNTVKTRHPGSSTGAICGTFACRIAPRANISV